jgi:hypothetical protein
MRTAAALDGFRAVPRDVHKAVAPECDLGAAYRSAGQRRPGDAVDADSSAFALDPAVTHTQLLVVDVAAARFSFEINEVDRAFGVDDGVRLDALRRGLEHGHAWR